MHPWLMYYLLLLMNFLGFEEGQYHVERKLGIKRKRYVGLIIAVLWPIFVPIGLSLAFIGWHRKRKGTAL